MGKTKLSTMGSNNDTGSNGINRRLTIANWDKIAVGIDRVDTLEAESFYAVRIGSLGAVIVHREIDVDHCVVVEVSNNKGDEVQQGRVWIGSVTLQNPIELLDRFMNVLTEKGWI
jgi:hypothetical protein